jgi:hypothetical protein
MGSRQAAGAVRLSPTVAAALYWRLAVVRSLFPPAQSFRAQDAWLEEIIIRVNSFSGSRPFDRKQYS